ncbi:MAG: response regulator [bacterium]|nr:response regulator [bacterium]
MTNQNKTTHDPNTLTAQEDQELPKAQKLEPLGILVCGIAHDFNNLLTTIIGTLSIIQSKVQQAGSDLEDLLTEVKQASEQAKRLAQELLTLVMGGTSVRKISSLPKLLKDIISFTLRGCKAKCELFIQDDLWPVRIDEGQIGQVISNLMINASQAMPEGGLIEVRAENVMIKAKKKVSPKDATALDRDDCQKTSVGRYIRLSFKDHGVGIPQEHLHRIFEPYFTTKQEGFGLGLTITNYIVKNHGGVIEVESRVGAGSTFYIYLPASIEEATEETALAEQTTAEEKLRGEKPLAFGYEHLRHRRGRILFMDDKPNIRAVAERMLRHLQYEVELAKDGLEAINLYQKARISGQPFDAVILDLVVLNGMGGKEAVQKLLEIDPEVKAIVSSGYLNGQLISEYQRYGFSAAITKPYNLEDLTRVLDQVMKTEKSNSH